MSLRRGTALAVVAAGIGLVAGYGIRDQQPTVTLRTGQGHSTPYQIGLTSKDWSYGVPLVVSWRDKQGTWNQGSRPACLQPTGEIAKVKFATVDVQGGGGPGTRQVVWIDCG